MKNTRRYFIKAAVGAGLSVAAGLYLLKYLRRQQGRPTLDKGVDYINTKMSPDHLRLCETSTLLEAKGFSIQGEKMSDGQVVPPYHDGMGCFEGINGEIILARNHEVPDGQYTVSPLPDFAYDPACNGGVTAIKLDKDLNILEQKLILTGTLVNCGGGKTPWNTWLTCEENVSVVTEKHGYVFEVDPFAVSITQAIPLKGMGRFLHEAATVHEATGSVYMTEDRYDGCLYRFIPHQKTKLNQGGVLQALRASAPLLMGQSQMCDWVTLSEVDSDLDDLRYRAQKLGATVFARGEGIITEGSDIYFAATSGGKKALGQIFKLKVASACEIELIYEAQEDHLLQNPDQLTFNQWGDLIICEDPIGNTSSRILGLTNGGQLYTIARSEKSEWSGACFSPDYKYLFANLQKSGVTYAFTGDWSSLRASAL